MNNESLAISVQTLEPSTSPNLWGFAPCRNLLALGWSWAIKNGSTYIPRLVREQAFKHDLTWGAAVEMTECFRTGKPSNDAFMKPGTHMSNPAQLKSRAETEGSTNPVELTPRSAVTEKVTSAIKLKDGRKVPVGDGCAAAAAPSSSWQLRRQVCAVAATPSSSWQLRRHQCTARKLRKHQGTARQLLCRTAASTSSGSSSSSPHQSWWGPIAYQS